MNRIFIRISVIISLCAGLLFCTACSEKPKKLTEKETLMIKNLNADARWALEFKDYERAQRNYDGMVEIDPTDPTIRLSLGINQYRLDKKSEARASYKKGMTLAERGYKSTKNPIYLIERARALALLGKVEEAVSTLEKARKLHPDNRQVLVLTNPGNPNSLNAYFRSAEFKSVAFLEK